MKLCGFVGMPEVERQLARGPIALDLPADVTVSGLVERLAERYGASFRRKALTGDGRVRSGVRVFVDDALVEREAPLADVLRDDSKISIVLLMAQSIGG
jgi:hypothetical protein